MAAITNPGTKVTEFSGVYKLLALDALSLSSNSDALTLSYAENGVTEIVTVVPGISGSAGTLGLVSAISVTYSGLVITVTSADWQGAAASTLTGKKVNLLVVCK